MKNYKKTSYAANKYSKDIVYKSEVSENISITLEDFLKADPKHTKEEFDYWKNWSDNNYEGESTHTNKTTKKDVSFSNFSEALSDCGVSLDVYYEEKETERIYYEAIHRAIDMLYADKRFTKKMKKRFEMRYYEGMNCEKIGKTLGVDAKSVRSSVKSALKKFKSYFFMCLAEYE